MFATTQHACDRIGTVAAYNLALDFCSLAPMQIDWVESAAACLLPLYAGEWAATVCNPKDQIVGAFRTLRTHAAERRKWLEDSIAYHKWMAEWRNLQRWIRESNDSIEQILRDSMAAQTGEINWIACSRRYVCEQHLSFTNLIIWDG